MTYKQFETLYGVMYKQRQVQCYGGWYGAELDDHIDVDTVSALYMQITEELQKEGYSETCVTLNDVIKYHKQGYYVISKRKIYEYLNELPEEDLLTIRLNLADYVKYIQEEKLFHRNETLEGLQFKNKLFLQTYHKRVGELKKKGYDYYLSNKKLAEADALYEAEYAKDKPLKINEQIKLEDIGL